MILIFSYTWIFNILLPPQKNSQRGFSPLTGWVTPRETPNIGFERWIVWLDADTLLLNFDVKLEDFTIQDFDLTLGDPILVVKSSNILGVWSFRTWQFFVNLLSWDSELSEPFNLQLGVQNVTLNHLVFEYIYIYTCLYTVFSNILVIVKRNLAVTACWLIIYPSLLSMLIHVFISLFPLKLTWNLRKAPWKMKHIEPNRQFFRFNLFAFRFRGVIGWSDHHLDLD